MFILLLQIAEALKTTENPYYDDSETLVIAQGKAIERI